MVTARDLGPVWSLEAVERLEAKTGEKFELVNGLVFAMAGASDAHLALAAEMMTQLGMQLSRGPRRGQCVAFQSDARVRVLDEDFETYRYPDIAVFCGERQRTGSSYVNPVVLIEITSPSTERVDQRTKLHEYTRIPSLEAYLLVDPGARRVTLHRRVAVASWREEDHVRGRVELPGTPAHVDIDELFAALPPP
ncbi:MAG: Uma2 family endonuclease [Myxococcota bacterium]